MSRSTAFKKFLIIASSLLSVYGSPMLDHRQTAASLPAPWVSVGCFNDAPATRTLRVASFTDVSNMTIESCLAFCTSPVAYTFAGVEFSRECFCDNIIESTGAEIDSSTCNMPCTGDADEICGGTGAINVFRNADIALPPPPAPPGTTKQTAGTFQFQGCYQDGVNGAPRSLPNQVNIQSVTAESCTTACKNAGFTVAGLEFGQECWCGSYMTLATRAPDSECNFSCAGDSTELCGAGNRLSVYVDTAVPPLNPNACLANSAISPSSPNSFKFNLQMVPASGNGSPVLLGAVFTLRTWHRNPEGLIRAFPKAEFNVTAEAHIFTLTGNTYFPDGAIPQVFGTVAVQPVVDQSQSFQPNIDASPFEGFCPMVNPLSPSTFIGPPILSAVVNGQTGFWGSCNLTGPVSFNPLTPIFSPTGANGAVCTNVVLVMTPPLVGV
ncbi:hypothetical protein D9613_002308 [Agrocybe pediades]|uniref:WSC domain-containing protein n=1 Tax=Agrocybe pediades TaxID=84607 RepID=A0A8H4VXN0_9AGAR|nr:hypothetical protein D9613_002308 [Agrocybe pediades]